MELFLIRHGQSTNNALADATLRVEDPLLTTAGERQAESAALHIANGAHLHEIGRRPDGPMLDRLYCSPMIRAMQTAHIIGAAISMPPEVWVELHEIGGVYLDHGERKVGYPGRSRSELASRFPNCILAPQLRESGWWNRAFEEAHEGYDRAAAVARLLRERWRENLRIGLVSHGDFLSALINALSDQHPSEGAYYDHRNTGITHLELTEPRPRIRYLNRVAHLDDALLT